MSSRLFAVNAIALVSWRLKRQLVRPIRDDLKFTFWRSISVDWKYVFRIFRTTSTNQPLRLWDFTNLTLLLTTRRILQFKINPGQLQKTCTSCSIIVDCLLDGFLPFALVFPQHTAFPSIGAPTFSTRASVTRPLQLLSSLHIYSRLSRMIHSWKLFISYAPLKRLLQYYPEVIPIKLSILSRMRYFLPPISFRMGGSFRGNITQKKEGKEAITALKKSVSVVWQPWKSRGERQVLGLKGNITLVLIKGRDGLYDEWRRGIDRRVLVTKES